ncbi:MAG: sulfatase [Bryobacter sp.]|nr:sulfatase [Bryobacter sp.]
MMKRRTFLSTAGASLAAAEPPSKPNILFVLWDDLGYPTLGTYGNKLVPTPNLDKLAREGVRFSSAYVTPQCTPTRATLLTGQYTARNKMWHVIPYYHYPYGRVREEPFKENLLRTDFTLAKGLQSAGYRTGIFGKWHLTANEDGHYTNLKPEASRYYGFDVTSTPPKIPDEQNKGDKAVLRLTEECIQFMTETKSQPFFAYLPQHSIHGKVVAPLDLVDQYRKQGAPETGLNNSTYLAALHHMDHSIGLLRTALEKSGQWNNTAVVFLSDNGGVARNHKPSPRPGADGKLRPEINIEEFPSTPLRAWKGSAYEGGIRVPMLARFPGMQSSTGTTGRTIDTPVHAVDILPTFFSLAGAKTPAGYVTDGVNLRGLIERNRPLPERDLFFYHPFYDQIWLHTPTAVVRSGRYKLIEYFGDWVDDETREYHPEPKLELFDLAADIGERNNLAQAQPQRVAALRKKLHRWIADCGAKIPQANSNYDPTRALDSARGKPAE